MRRREQTSARATCRFECRKSGAVAVPEIDVELIAERAPSPRTHSRKRSPVRRSGSTGPPPARRGRTPCPRPRPRQNAGANRISGLAFNHPLEIIVLNVAALGISVPSANCSTPSSRKGSSVIQRGRAVGHAADHPSRDRIRPGRNLRLQQRFEPFGGASQSSSVIAVQSASSMAVSIARFRAIEMFCRPDTSIRRPSSKRSANASATGRASPSWRIVDHTMPTAARSAHPLGADEQTLEQHASTVHCA